MALTILLLCTTSFYEIPFAVLIITKSKHVSVLKNIENALSFTASNVCVQTRKCPKCKFAFDILLDNMYAKLFENKSLL